MLTASGGRKGTNEEAHRGQSVVVVLLTVLPCNLFSRAYLPLAPIVVLWDVVLLDEQPVDLRVDSRHPLVHACLVLRQQEPNHLQPRGTKHQTPNKNRQNSFGQHTSADKNA